jgi:hypothetical protein
VRRAGLGLALFAASLARGQDLFDDDALQHAEPQPVLRILVSEFGGGAVGASSTVAPALSVALTLAQRQESNGFSWDAGRFEGLGGPAAQRFAWRLLQLDELIIGERSGKVCVPAVLVAWPAGKCEAASGRFGFGATLLWGDHDFLTGRFNLRVLELAGRASLPHPALGPWYRAFRVSPHLGASLDFAGGWLLRGSAGADLVAAFEGPRLELRVGARWRPSLVDFAGSQLLEGTARLAWRGARELVIALELGGAWNSRPQTNIGPRASREAAVSWWAVLQFEATALRIL